MNGTHWCRSPRPHFFLFFYFPAWPTVLGGTVFFLERESGAHGNTPFGAMEKSVVLYEKN